MKRKPNVSRLMPSRYGTNKRAQNTAWCREMLQTADYFRLMTGVPQYGTCTQMTQFCAASKLKRQLSS